MSILIVEKTLMLHLPFETIKFQVTFVYLINVHKEEKKKKRRRVNATCLEFLQLKLFYSAEKIPTYKLDLTKLIPVT